MSAADRGEVVYRTNCISCHNRDPNLPGPIGPAIADSPRALIEARVLHGTYPPGYAPQRTTRTMRESRGRGRNSATGPVASAGA